MSRLKFEVWLGKEVVNIEIHDNDVSDRLTLDIPTAKALASAILDAADNMALRARRFTV